MNRRVFVKSVFAICEKYEVKMTKKEEKKLKAVLNTAYLLGGKNKTKRFIDEFEKRMEEQKNG